MSTAAERRKHIRTRKTAPQTIRISFEDRPGYPKSELAVTLLDISDGGCRIGLQGPLGVGSAVFLDRQALTGNGKPEAWMARVMWCSQESDGAYTAGLKLECPACQGTRFNTAQPAAPIPNPVPDYYELLQVNPKADPDTIHRVYRILAQRFHPDNPDSGSEEMFRQLLGAYKVLSDPAERASYDVKHELQGKQRWKIFGQTSAMNGRVAEQAKRSGILLVLYTRRVNEPAQPSMSLHEMEDLLGCPREHLEFSLWYLREKGYVQRSDNSRFTITALGVEAAVAADMPWAREDRMLAGRPH